MKHELTHYKQCLRDGCMMFYINYGIEWCRLMLLHHWSFERAYGGHCYELEAWRFELKKICEIFTSEQIERFRLIKYGFLNK